MWRNPPGRPTRLPRTELQPSGKAIAFKVHHLPPLELRFELPRRYPSVDPPSQSIKCAWLTHTQQLQAKALLDDVWEAEQGTPIM